MTPLHPQTAPSPEKVLSPQTRESVSRPDADDTTWESFRLPLEKPQAFRCL